MGTLFSPVVKDLAAKDVSPDTPAVLIALVTQVVMPKHLDVKVVNLERAVMDMGLGAFKYEETVVICKRFTQVYVYE